MERHRFADLEVGTGVVVTRDDGSTFTTRTRSKPWQLGHGGWVVSLVGAAGCFDLDRIERTWPTTEGATT